MFEAYTFSDSSELEGNADVAVSRAGFILDVDMGKDDEALSDEDLMSAVDPDIRNEDS